MSDELDVRSQIIFSHRPDLGISLGVYTENNTAFLGVSFCRIGGDTFNKKVANSVIIGRIAKMTNGHNVTYCYMVNNPRHLSAYDIVSQLRTWFKDRERSDILMRSNGRRIGTDGAFFEICEMFREVLISNENISC